MAAYSTRPGMNFRDDFLPKKGGVTNENESFWDVSSSYFVWRRLRSIGRRETHRIAFETLSEGRIYLAWLSVY